MLRTVTILMTAATVLWHAVVGCCAHHSRAIDATPTPAKVRRGAGKCDEPRRCCCKHQIPASATKPKVEDHAGDWSPANDETPADHVPFTPCDGKKCSFAVSKIATANDRDPTPLGFDYSNAGRAILLIESSARECAHEADLKPPPLRRHLALGVLLI
jgi:hypothetical protein